MSKNRGQGGILNLLSPSPFARTSNRLYHQNAICKASYYTGKIIRDCTRIAYLTNELVANNPQKMWQGVVDAASARNVNTVCLVGGFLRAPGRQAANILYDLVSQQAVDGVVIRGHLCTEVDHEQEMAFYRRFQPLPCVVIGRQAGGIPHLIMDGYTGMRDAVSHLIDVHRRQRIAFFRGPELYDAEERYRAYKDVLRDYDIPFWPELVTPPLLHWDSPESFEANSRYLLDLLDRSSFDALVTSSDTQAQQLIPLLKARGLRIPEDISVVGFNNTSSVTTPRLTSVDAGFYEQGKRGTEMLLKLLDGQHVPERLLLPTRLHVRQSCGCFDAEVVRAAARPVSIVEPAGAALSQPVSPLSRLRLVASSAHEQWYASLLYALIDQLEGGQPDHFLRVLEGMLRSAAASSEEMDTWHNRISALREQTLPCLMDVQDIIAAEDLFQQARVLVSQSMLWEQSKKRKDAQQRTNLLYEISQTLITTFDTTKLMGVLARELPRLDIPRAIISLYPRPDQPQTTRLMMAYNERGLSPLSHTQPLYPASQWVPDDLLPADHTYSLVVEPLHFQDEQLGLAIFEVGPREGNIYDVLRGQISNALKGAQLFLQNTRLYREAKDAQKSAEEADRLKSRFLASVSHELRTPLNMLIGLSEMLTDDPGDGRPPLPAVYHQDLKRISTSAHHLDDLLRDVLDLAHSQVGRLKLVRKPLDLRDVLETVSALVEPIIIQRGLAWHMELPPVLVPVWGDAARLKQVLLNLIHNAAKFTAEGEIALSIQMGNGEVTVAISDTGLGIPLEEQDLIFDEFQTTQRAAARGYGGMGLGLAICRKLIEMHNGRIGVSSPGEGSGSTFYFTLPTMTHYPARSTPQDIPPKQTVLLIGEKHQRDPYLEEHLLREGFEIETLQVNASVPGSLPVMFDIPPALVILDMEIQSSHSQELIRLVKEHPQMQDVPILFYSLFQERGAMFVWDHLAKPVDTGTLSRALARYGLEDHQQQTTILVVDDDRGTLDMNIRAVQAQVPGCHVIEADNGRTALRLMRQWQPDLVLLDLMMPEMDGFDVLLAMQEDEAIRHIPTIVLTAMSLTEEDMARMSRGAAAILSKGVFSLDETLQHIESVLARNRHLGSEAQRVVRKVMVYIHQHYTGALSRGDMAAYAGVSERHLDRCFQQDMGITPVSYLNRYRVRQAKTLLIQSGKSLTEIAMAVGFSSSSHFSRVFRREVGTSPSAYQRGE